MARDSGSPDRRTFLSAVGAASGLALIGVPPAIPAPRRAQTPEEWDFAWLDRLTGRHRQVFDLGSLNDPLNVVANYLRAFREVRALEHPDVNAVVGIASSAFPINAGDALWARYELGRRWQVRDPDTGEWAVRNVFDADPPPKGAKPIAMARDLRARGAIFWQCNNALNGITEWLAGETHQAFDAVRAELIAGFRPGVILVPAHTMLIGLAQERGCTYEKL